MSAFAAFVLLACAVGFPLLTRATLDTPQILSYQGRLTDNNKVPVADGPQAMSFVIYDASVGGTCVWSAGNTDANTSTVDCGVPGTINVTVTDSLFNVLLGDVNDPSANAQNLFPDSLFNTTGERWLEVTIGAETLTPRRRIVSSATALQAGNASLLDGFNTSQAGGIAAFVPVTESDGDLILSANFTVDTGTLYVDATNNRVGIGRSDPGSLLTVGASNGVSGTDSGKLLYVAENTASTRGMRFENALVTLDFVASTDGAGYVGTFTNSSLGLQTNNVVRMTVLGSGNVGIGTVSPDNALDVVGTIDATGFIRSTDNAGVPTTGTGVELVYPTGAPWNGTGILDAINRDTDAMRPISINASDITFRTSTTGAASLSQPRMTIDVSGNVGVGDTNPASLFTVGSGDLFRVDSSGRVFAPNGASGAGNLAYSFVGDTDTGLYRSAANEIRFQTNGTDRMTLDQDGDVGIGTTNAVGLLHARRDTNAAAEIIIQNTTNDTAAKPQINLAGPAGNFYLANYPSSNTESAVWASRAVIQSDIGIGGMVIGPQNGALQFQTGGSAVTPRVTIISTGEVGIGDTSPAAMFTVGSGDLFQVDSSGRVFAPNGASGAGNLAYSFVNDTNTGFYRSASDEIRFQTAGADRVTLDASGNVGIGNTAPGAKLHVTSTSAAAVPTIIRGAASQTANLTNWQNSAGTTLAYIDSSGNVTTGADFLAATAASLGTGYTKTALSDTSIPFRLTETVIPSDGNPVIVWIDGSGNLKAAKCTAGDCSTVNATVTLDTGATVESISADLGPDGNPFIVYAKSGDVRVAHCTSQSCTVADLNTVANTANTLGARTSTALISAASAMAIAFTDQTANTTLYLRCDNPTNATPCSSSTSIVTVGGDSFAGDNVALLPSYMRVVIVGDGMPLIFTNASYVFTVSAATVAHKCSATDCTGGITDTTLTGTTVAGGISDAAVGPDGFAAVVQNGNAAGGPIFTRCTNNACTTFSNVSLGYEPGSFFQFYHAAVVIPSSNNPVLYLTQDGNGNPSKRYYAVCSTSTCSSKTTTDVVIDGPETDTTASASAAINAAGDVVGVLTRSNGISYALKVFIGSVLATGTDVGSSATRLANGYFSGEVKMGSLTIDGTGGGQGGISTLGSVTIGDGSGTDKLTVNLGDNLADAIDIQQGSNDYLNITTANGAEKITFGNSSTNPNYLFTGSGGVGIGTTTASARLTVGDAASTITERLLVQSQVDAILELSADTDNAGGENDNPYILLRQDTGGNNTHSLIGLSGDIADTAPNGEAFTGSGRNNALLIGNFGQDPILIGTNARTLFTMEGMSDAVGLYTLAPQNAFQVSPVQYETGTASQTGTTITGVGTTFTSGMVGSLFTFNDGTVRTITAFTDATTLTVAETGTVASQNFRINYKGFNVTSIGRVGIGTLSPSQLLHVENTTGNVEALIRVNDPDDNGYSASIRVDGGGGGGDASYVIDLDGVNQGSFGSAGGGITLQSNAAGGYHILSTGDEIMSWLDSGNIGIGDTSPAAMLTVGNGDLFQVSAAGNILFNDDANHTISVNAEQTTNTAGKSLTLTAGAGNGTGAGGQLILRGGDDGGTSSDSGQVLIETMDAADDTGSMLISTGDTAGIGSTSGSITLDVGISTSGTNGSLFLGGNASNITIGGAFISTDISINAPVDIDGGVELNLQRTGVSEAVCHTGDDATYTNVILEDCATTVNADYMEMYAVAADVGVGDLLMPGAISVTTTTGEVIQQLVKATDANMLMAVASDPTKAGDFNSIGYNIAATDNPWPVALNGRVPVKVNMEGGAIVAGDFVTLSSVAGIGAKATGPGYVIGRAISGFAGPGQGTVMIYVNPQYWLGQTLLADGTIAMSQNSISMKKSGTEVFSVNQTGDVQIAGKLFLSDRGTMQNSKYIYYDSSASPMDYMRTNASGWATGSYDFAELFPSKDTSIQAGELVMIDTENPEHIVRARYESRDLLMGIVSTRPGFLAGEWDNNQTKYAIALAGRVPTKVTTENGTIKKGDPLTISSKPGVAMKASTVGNVVGYALEDATQDATIIVLVRSQYFAPVNSASSMPSAAAVVSTFDIHQDLDMKGYALMNLREIKGLKWSIDAEGNIKAKNVAAESFAVRQTGDEASVGRGFVETGEQEIVMQNAFAHPNSAIFVTWLDNPGSAHWIADQQEGSFTIKLAAPATMAARFTYWILDIVDERPPATEVTAPAPAADAPAESVVSTEIADPVVSTEVAEPTVSTEVAEIVVEDPPATPSSAPAPAQQETVVPQETVVVEQIQAVEETPVVEEVSQEEPVQEEAIPLE